MEYLGEPFARPHLFPKSIGELPQEDDVGALVQVFPVDVHENLHMEVRFGIHSFGEWSEECLGLASGVEGVARDEDAFPGFAEQFLDDDCRVPTRSSCHLISRPYELHSVGNGLG